MDNEDSVPLILQIMDHEYRVVCHPSEQQDLTAAAAYLNQRLQEIRNNSKVLGTERLAVMAALNASYELLKQNKKLQKIDEAVNSRLKELTEKVESAISKSTL
jgi:cell division protein ZapA